MYVETPYVQYRHGRVFNHLIRFSGPIRVTGPRPSTAPRSVDRWYGARDHSWGIRSTMGPHIPINGVEIESADEDRRAVRIWVPFETDREKGFFHQHEDAEGRVLDMEGLGSTTTTAPSSTVTAVDTPLRALHPAPADWPAASSSSSSIGTAPTTRPATVRGRVPAVASPGLRLHERLVRRRPSGRVPRRPLRRDRPVRRLRSGGDGRPRATYPPAAGSAAPSSPPHSTARTARWAWPTSST